jgi:hypothetical protein
MVYSFQDHIYYNDNNLDRDSFLTVLVRVLAANPAHARGPKVALVLQELVEAEAFRRAEHLRLNKVYPHLDRK